MRTITSTMAGLLLTCALLLSGCYGDDIDGLKDEQSKQAERIAALETWQQTVNSNITALQGLVSALEAKDFVTAVTPKIENGVEVGHTITFTQSGPVVIYHGQKGDNGLTPVIGVAKDTDGLYYWTLQLGADEVDWLLDGSGGKIPTTGAAGRDATSPQIRINPSTNYWEISTDGGSSWQSTDVKATGPQGPSGSSGSTGAQGDAIFAANGIDNTNDNYVEFTLANGTTKIRVPRYIALGITFEQPGGFLAGQAQTIDYTLKGETPAVITAINIPAGWKVLIDKTAKNIQVTAPAIADLASAGYGEALILISDGGERTVIRTLNLSNIVSANEKYALCYQNGEATGVVFRIKSENVKGLVVHKLKDDLGWGLIETTLGCNDENDGLANWAIITALPDWENIFPAFKWCADRGTGWYLPALYELIDLFSAFYSDEGAFNKPLTDMGGNEFSRNELYFSSTESNLENMAKVVSFSSGLRDNASKHNYIPSIRAVLFF